jgi:hypothetical protein
VKWRIRQDWPFLSVLQRLKCALKALGFLGGRSYSFGPITVAQPYGLGFFLPVPQNAFYDFEHYGFPFGAKE